MENNDGKSSQADAPEGAAQRGSAEGAILICCALAWLGLSISILLVQQHAGVPTLFCPVRGGCEAVLSSKYASVLRVPLPWLGVGFYTMMLALLLGAYGVQGPRARVRLLGAVLWISVMGASASAALMFIQFGMLHAFCPLCTASAVVVTALAVASGMAETRGGDAAFAGRRAGALALALFAMIPAVAQLLTRAAVQGDVLAVVDGEKFTRAQMEEELGASLRTLRQSVYAREFAWVRKKVDGALLAAKQNAQSELAARIGAVKPASEKEIATWLVSEGLPNTPENAVKAKDALFTESQELARTVYLEELAAGHRIEVFLEQPKSTTLQIDLTTAKISGPREAKVQLVVFSDFQCPFCKELAAVLKKVRADYPADVMLAYRYFPIESHPRALPTAIAAECAAEQGAFWEYHDKLYAEAGNLGDARLTAIATAVNLDEGKFLECRNSGRARNVVEASRADAIASGLEGAPALFLNGKRIGGMIDYEHLAGQIREALRSADIPGGKPER